MAQASVTDVADTLIQHLSKGYRQRTALADALVGSPPLLILDEPTAGLDPNQIRQVRALIRELGKDHTILLSTHILSEVESVCDRAIVIHKGRVVAQGSLQELGTGPAGRGAALLVRDPEHRAREILAQLQGVTLEEHAGDLAHHDAELTRLRLTLSEGADASETVEKAVSLLVAAGVRVRDARALGTSLEDTFAELTRDDRGAEAPKRAGVA
jgi:ABC-2 type transport system ATP-binding protein